MAPTPLKAPHPFFAPRRWRAVSFSRGGPKARLAARLFHLTSSPVLTASASSAGSSANGTAKFDRSSRPGSDLTRHSDSLGDFAQLVLAGKSPEQQKLIIADFIEELRAKARIE